MLSHVDKKNRPAMVDVSAKEITSRVATACSVVRLPKKVLEQVNKDEIFTKKGPVFQTAIIAGTMAAKKTSELIPFCHPIGLEACAIDIVINADQKVVISCTVRTQHKTGVEMEALVGASTAALTVYDMCKALSHEIVIEETKLLEKKGGKSGDYRAL